jgi:hypothetical protein
VCYVVPWRIRKRAPRQLDEEQASRLKELMISGVPTEFDKTDIIENAKLILQLTKDRSGHTPPVT